MAERVSARAHSPTLRTSGSVSYCTEALEQTQEKLDSWNNRILLLLDARRPYQRTPAHHMGFLRTSQKHMHVTKGSLHHQPGL